MLKDKRRVSLQEFIDTAKSIHGNLYDYSQVQYEHCLSPVKIICKNHGVFEQAPTLHYSSKVPCPLCRVEANRLAQRKTTKQFIAEAKAVHGTRYGYQKVHYTTNKQNVEIVCKKHGVFKQSPTAHLRGQGCPQCATDSSASTRRHSFAQFVSNCRKVHGNRYEYNKSTYQGVREHLEIVCKTHGAFSQSGNNHLAGTGCPVCGTVATMQNRTVTVISSSRIEKSVAKWLKSFVRVKTKYILPDGKEIDIYLPEQKVGIEINGLYWHSKKPPLYHIEKSALASKEGITLFHLWEHWLSEKPAIVKSMLRIRLNFVKTRIFARETTVKPLTLKEESDFFNASHIQGFIPSKYCYGLFLDEKLVMAMSFCKPRFNKLVDWEILRMAASLNTVVIGGASKLFAAFRKDVSPVTVGTYANLDYGLGAVYEKMGFDFLHIAKPNYFWVKGRRVFSRYQAQKHRLGQILGSNFDPSKSESENMENAGFLKVYNSGNAVYLWKASKC